MELARRKYLKRLAEARVPEDVEVRSKASTRNDADMLGAVVFSLS